MHWSFISNICNKISKQQRYVYMQLNHLFILQLLMVLQ
uniref:Uncharacterized protein n=1 Tax=Brugia timori TaxID=42155 RepID=A0A0R3RCJ8_9BILA